MRARDVGASWALACPAGRGGQARRRRSEYLERPSPFSQKGGTLIAADVTGPATHVQRLCDPG